MSQITVEQYEALEKLSPEERAAAMAEYRANATGSEIPPEVQKKLMAEAMELASRNTDGEAIRQRSELELIAPPGLTLGPFECRPLSMGVIQILERINHPLFSGDGDEMALGDVVAIMYCLCEPDIAKLVQESMEGNFESGANAWAFDLSMDQLLGMQEQLEPMLDAAEGLPQEPTGKPKKRRARNR